MGLPVNRFREIVRWYRELSALQAWRDALAYKDTAMELWQSSKAVA
jgi:hypothetical protein